MSLVIHLRGKMMSSLFERIKSLNEEVSYPWMLQPINCMWTFSDNDVHWDTDNNLEDLENHNGETYGGEYWEGYHEQDGCYFFNYDNGCGETITAVFLKDKLVSFDE